MGLQVVSNYGVSPSSHPLWSNLEANLEPWLIDCRPVTLLSVLARALSLLRR